MTGTDPYRALISHQLQENQQSLASLQSDFDRLVEAAADANADDEHDPEGATIAFERAQLSAAIERAQQQRRELLAALDRLADGSYGRCQSCGSPIAESRLLARPATRFCVRCA